MRTHFLRTQRTYLIHQLSRTLTRRQSIQPTPGHIVHKQTTQLASLTPTTLVPGTSVMPSITRVPGTSVMPYITDVPGTTVIPPITLVPGTTVMPCITTVPGTTVMTCITLVPGTSVIRTTRGHIAQYVRPGVILHTRLTRGRVLRDARPRVVRL